MTVISHCPHDVRDLRCVSIKESLDQTGCLGGSLSLNDLVTNGEPAKNSSDSQESNGQDTSDPMHAPRPFHHLALRIGPVPLLGQQPDVCPFEGGRQLAVLGFGVPRRRPFRQPKFGPSSTGLPLLAGQPVPQGVDKIIVRELVILSARSCRLILTRGSLPGRWG